MVKKDSVDLAVLANDIKYIKAEVSEIKGKMESGYVKREEFEPVKKIVYGMVAFLLLALLGAIIKLVIIG